MNSIITVMKFTMKDMLHKKSFIVATIVLLLMIIIGFNIPRIIKSFKNNDNSKLLIVDNSNIYENKLSLLKEPLKEYELAFSNDVTLDSIKEKINNDEIDMGIFVNLVDNNINLTYIVDNIYLYSNDPVIIDSMSNLYKSIQIDKLNIDQYEKQNLTRVVTYDVIQSSEEAKGNILLMMILSMFLFYAIYFNAFQVSNSVTLEKTSKIIETLATSTSPRNIIIGKTLGIGLIGLSQALLIVFTAYISANLFIDKELLSSILDTSTLTFTLGVLTFIYFILGYFVFSFIYALTGSTVSKPEDIQSANSPVAIITLLGFYLSYYTIMNPNSGLSGLASFLPISSPFYMPFRIMMGLATTKDVIISLAILLTTIIIISHIAIKIYSNAILNSGSKLNLKNILSMYKENN